MKTIPLLAILLASATLFHAQAPKYAADVPESVLTPDKVETKLLGDLEFFDGMPSKETVTKAYDFPTSPGARKPSSTGYPRLPSTLCSKVSGKPGSIRGIWASSRT